MVNNDITTRDFWGLEVPKQKQRTISDIDNDLKCHKITLNDARKELGFPPIETINSGGTK